MESFQEIANRKGGKTQRKARKGKRMKSIAGSLDTICCSPRNAASIFTFAPYLPSLASPLRLRAFAVKG